MVIIPNNAKEFTTISKTGGGGFGGGGGGGKWEAPKGQEPTREAPRKVGRKPIAGRVGRAFNSSYRTSKRSRGESSYDRNLRQMRENAQRKAEAEAAEKARVAREADRATSLRATEAEARRREQQRAANIARQETYSALKEKQDRYRRQQEAKNVLGAMDSASTSNASNPNFIRSQSATAQNTSSQRLTPTWSEFQQRVDTRVDQAVEKRPILGSKIIRPITRDIVELDEALKVGTKDIVGGSLERVGVTPERAGRAIATASSYVRPMSALPFIVRERSIQRGREEYVSTGSNIVQGYIEEYRDQPLKQVALFGAGYTVGAVTPAISAGGVKLLGAKGAARAGTALKIISPIAYTGIKGYQMNQLETKEEREQFIGKSAAELTSFGLGVYAGTPKPNVEIREAGQTQRTVVQQGDKLRFYDESRSSALGKVGTKKYVLKATGEARGTVTGRDLVLQQRGSGTITNYDLQGNAPVEFKYGQVLRGVASPSGSQSSGAYVVTQKGNIVDVGRSISISTGSQQQIQTVNFGFSQDSLKSISASKGVLQSQFIQGAETVSVYRSAGTVTSGTGVNKIIQGFGQFQTGTPVSSVSNALSSAGTSTAGSTGGLSVSTSQVQQVLPLSSTATKFFSGYLGAQASSQASLAAGSALVQTSFIPALSSLSSRKSGVIGGSITGQDTNTGQVTITDTVLDQEITQDLDQGQDQDIITDTGQGIQYFFGSSSRTTPITTQITVTPPATPPPAIPLIGIPPPSLFGFSYPSRIGSDSFSFFGRNKRVKGSQYLPSFAGLLSGETISEEPLIADPTGVRLPVARKTKRKKGKSKKKKTKKKPKRRKK